MRADRSRTRLQVLLVAISSLGSVDRLVLRRLGSRDVVEAAILLLGSIRASSILAVRHLGSIAAITRIRAGTAADKAVATVVEVMAVEGTTPVHQVVPEDLHHGSVVAAVVDTTAMAAATATAVAGMEEVATVAVVAVVDLLRGNNSSNKATARRAWTSMVLHRLLHLRVVIFRLHRHHPLEMCRRRLRRRSRQAVRQRSLRSWIFVATSLWSTPHD